MVSQDTRINLYDFVRLMSVCTYMIEYGGAGSNCLDTLNPFMVDGAIAGSIQARCVVTTATHSTSTS